AGGSAQQAPGSDQGSELACHFSFPGSAWERTAREALPRHGTSKPRFERIGQAEHARQHVPRRSLGTRSMTRASLRDRAVSMSSSEQKRIPRKRFQAKDSKLQRVYEALIEFALLCSGLFSIAITFGIAAVVIYGSVEFFRDPKVSIVYFFTGMEWSAGFQDA